MQVCPISFLKDYKLGMHMSLLTPMLLAIVSIFSFCVCALLIVETRALFKANYICCPQQLPASAKAAFPGLMVLMIGGLALGTARPNSLHQVYGPAHPRPASLTYNDNLLAMSTTILGMNILLDLRTSQVLLISISEVQYGP